MVGEEEKEEEEDDDYHHLFLQEACLTLDGWQRFFDRKWVSILLVDAWAIPEFPPGSEIGQ